MTPPPAASCVLMVLPTALTFESWKKELSVAWERPQRVEGGVKVASKVGGNLGGKKTKQYWGVSRACAYHILGRGRNTVHAYWCQTCLLEVSAISAMGGMCSGKQLFVPNS